MTGFLLLLLLFNFSSWYSGYQRKSASALSDSSMFSLFFILILFFRFLCTCIHICTPFLSSLPFFSYLIFFRLILFLCIFFYFSLSCIIFFCLLVDNIVCWLHRISVCVSDAKFQFECLVLFSFSREHFFSGFV